MGKVGIIWNGRGLASYYSAGFALAIRERGIKEIYRQGISGGAFNALGADDPARVIAIWKEIVEKRGPSFLFDVGSVIFSRRVVSNIRRIIKGLSPIFSNSSLEELANYFNFEELLKSASVNGVRTEIAVFNESTWTQEFVSTDDLRVRANPEILRWALIASASIHEFFPAIPIYPGEDGLYSDGRIISIKRAIDYGCDTVFLLLNEASGPPKRSTQGFYRLLSEITANSEIPSRISEQHELDSNEGKAMIIVIRPTAEVEKRTSTFASFKKGDISSGIKKAYEEALKILDNL